MAGCDCQVCRPQDDHDEDDRCCIDSVKSHGWQVISTGAEGGSSEPAFAYTVGLLHSADQPELLISGLPTELMNTVLNDVAARVLDGLPLSPGAGVEGALRLAPLVCEEIDSAAVEHTLSWSCWFHRRSVRGLQLVWPDTSGRFAWQPGAGDGVDKLQPRAWREGSARTGAFAVDPSWPLPVPPEQKVFVCRHIREGAPIGFVARQADRVSSEDWTFHCGREHVWSEDNLALWHVAHIVRMAPSIREVADLGIGELAWRSGPGRPWHRDRQRRHT